MQRKWGRIEKGSVSKGRVSETSSVFSEWLSNIVPVLKKKGKLKFSYSKG